MCTVLKTLDGQKIINFYYYCLLSVGSGYSVEVNALENEALSLSKSLSFSKIKINTLRRNKTFNVFLTDTVLTPECS